MGDRSVQDEPRRACVAFRVLGTSPIPSRGRRREGSLNRGRRCKRRETSPIPSLTPQGGASEGGQAVQAGPTSPIPSLTPQGGESEGW